MNNLNFSNNKILMIAHGDLLPTINNLEKAFAQEHDRKIFRIWTKDNPGIVSQSKVLSAMQNKVTEMLLDDFEGYFEDDYVSTRAYAVGKLIAGVFSSQNLDKFSENIIKKIGKLNAQEVLKMAHCYEGGLLNQEECEKILHGKSLYWDPDAWISVIKEVPPFMQVKLTKSLASQGFFNQSLRLKELYGVIENFSREDRLELLSKNFVFMSLDYSTLGLADGMLHQLIENWLGFIENWLGIHNIREDAIFQIKDRCLQAISNIRRLIKISDLGDKEKADLKKKFNKGVKTLFEKFNHLEDSKYERLEDTDSWYQKTREKQKNWDGPSWLTFGSERDNSENALTFNFAGPKGSALLSSFLQSTLSEEDFKGIVSLFQDDPGLVWNQYVVRKKDWGKSKAYNSTDQVAYGAWVHHAVKMGSYLLKKGYGGVDLLNFFAVQRNLIARTFCHDNNSVFGQIRDRGRLGALTDCEREYKEIPDFLLAKVQKEGELEGGLWKETAQGTEMLYYVAEIDNTPIKLSTFLKSPPRPPIIIHTNVADANIVMEHVVNTLFPAVMQLDDQQKVIESLGEIFWWICQAKPWRLGDPSIAELFFRCIMKSKGFLNLAWKEGIIPWLEVIKEPDVHQFAKNFNTFFDSDLSSPIST